MVWGLFLRKGDEWKVFCLLLLLLLLLLAAAVVVEILIKKSSINNPTLSFSSRVLASLTDDDRTGCRLFVVDLISSHLISSMV